MNQNRIETNTWTQLKAYLLPLLVVLALGVYLLRAFGIWTGGARVVLAAYLALGPLGVIGSIALGQFLDDGDGGLKARIGAVFGVAAFVIWELVMIVQAGSASLFRDHVAPGLVEALPDGETSARLIFRGISTVQASMDVAFDVFYCLAVIVFSSLMLQHRAFGRGIGWYGIAVASGLLILNIWTFPLPPAEAGLWDLGPFTAVWWIVMIVLWLRHDRRVAARDPGD